MYETILLARQLDERMWLMNRAGRAPFIISVQGHEGAQAGMGFALDTSKDWLLPYYRDLALVLHFGMTPRDMMMSFLVPDAGCDQRTYKTQARFDRDQPASHGSVGPTEVLETVAE
jgi:TPP-dependent pyruvate/acetoin dehydrogenase alpha subunit